MLEVSKRVRMRSIKEGEREGKVNRKEAEYPFDV